MKRKHMPGCTCCEPPVPCACDPELDGASIKLTSSDLPGGEYSFDVARPEGAVSVKFDVKIKLVVEIDMARAGQASRKVNLYGGDGYGGTELKRSTVDYWEWDQMLHLDRYLRAFGTVQFPTEPSCGAYVTCNLELIHEGEQNSLITLLGGNRPRSDRYTGTLTCVKPYGPNDLNDIVTTEACDWSLTPDPVGECNSFDSDEPPLKEPVPLNFRSFIPLSSTFEWSSCPEEGDAKSATKHFQEVWTAINGYFGRIGLMVDHIARPGAGVLFHNVGFCITDLWYVSDNSFDVTMEAEFYSV